MTMTRALLFFLPLLLSACAGSGGPWPDLAVRPGEGAGEGPCSARTSLTALPAARPAPPVAAPAIATVPDGARDPEATAQMAAELARIREAWSDALADAEASVRAAGPPGSVSWGSAQIALSRFESVFARTAAIDARLAESLPARALGVELSPERADLIESLERFRSEHIRAFDRLRDTLGAPAGLTQAAQAAARAG